MTVTEANAICARLSNDATLPPGEARLIVTLGEPVTFRDVVILCEREYRPKGWPDTQGRKVRAVYVRSLDLAAMRNAERVAPWGSPSVTPNFESILTSYGNVAVIEVRV